jgi:hypothetical protein
MTKKQLLQFVVLTLFFLFAVIIVGVVIYVFNKDALELYGKLTPVILAIIAAWLTYCIQARINFNNALRNTWDKLIDAISDVMILCNNCIIDDSARKGMIKKLNIAIEQIRSIYRNIGEKRNGYLGDFPFYPIKEILLMVEKMPFEDTIINREKEIIKIKVLWKAMRKEFLREFDRKKPTFTYSHWIDEEQISFIGK